MRIIKGYDKGQMNDVDVYRLSFESLLKMESSIYFFLHAVHLLLKAIKNNALKADSLHIFSLALSTKSVADIQKILSLKRTIYINELQPTDIADDLQSPDHEQIHSKLQELTSNIISDLSTENIIDLSSNDRERWRNLNEIKHIFKFEL